MKRIITLSLITICYLNSNGQGSWNLKTNLTTTGREGAFSFGIGTKGYMGGGKTTTDYLSDFWEYDPETNIWTQKANYTTTANARRRGIGFSIGDKGYTGQGIARDMTVYNDFMEYNPNTNIWTSKANFESLGRYAAVGFSIGTKGYIGTGVDRNYLKSDFWEYDPSTNTWTQKANFGGGARTYATGFCIGNKGYIGTGYDVNAMNDFWEYDPLTNRWTKKANFAGVARQSAVSFSIGSYGYLGTGLGSNFNALGDFYRYDPNTDSWTVITGLPARNGATAFSIGNKGYIGTGYDVNANPSNTFFQYDICGSLTSKISKTNVSCNDENNGSLVINATGGISPYQYSIDSGATFYSSNTFNNLIPDTYRIIVKDSNNCISTSKNSLITQPNLLSFTTSSINVRCNGGSNGSISVNVSGGTTPYQYSKDGRGIFQTSNIFSSLSSSTYSVLVKDANNCVTDTQNISITQPTAISFSTTKANVVCRGGNNGSIAVNSTGGVTPYQYSKNNGTSFQTSNIFSSLTAFTYSIVVKDSNNCITGSQNVIITQPSAISFTATPTNINCNGGNNGSITINVTGGTSPHQYSKDGGVTFQSSNTFLSLTAATYSIVVKDVNNCVSSPQNITITQPNTLSFSSPSQMISCNGANDGIITVSSTGGVSPYQYSKDGGITFQSSNTFLSLTAATYSIVVKDINNCLSNTKNITITEPSAIQQPTISANGQTVFCYGDSIILTASSGSSYLWSNGATIQSIAVKTSGNYTVQVTIGSCTKTSSATTIVVNSLPTATITSTGSTTFCQGGSVILTASAGSSYLWSNNATTQSITVSASGNYSVTATNTNGCSATSAATTVTVNSLPATPTITANGATTFCQGENVTLTASTGSSYLWSNNATTKSITVSASGNYSVTVTNVNGCSATSSATTVTVNPLPTVILGSVTSPLCVNSSTVPLSGIPSGGIFLGTGINGSDFNPSVSGAGTFTVSYNYIDTKGCSVADSQQVIVNLCTGITELTGSLVLIYPNPANEMLHITMDASLVNHAFIELYDAMGKLVTTEKAINENTSIAINSLATGIYIVSARQLEKTNKISTFQHL